MCLIFYITIYNMSKVQFYTDNRGLNYSFENKHQNLLSISKKGVLRGIHLSPYKKHITIISGSIVDYIININTLTYEKYILSADNNNTLEIPANYGHLFYTSSENTIVLYNLDGYYDSKTDKTFNYQDPELNLDICNNTDFIISEKDKNASFINTYDYMILGSSGFLGDYALKTLLKNGKNVKKCHYRLSEIHRISRDIEKFKIKYVICSAGISGKPSVSWCEDNKYQTYQVNLVQLIKLCGECNRLNIHLTIFGSGSVYITDDSNYLYKEDDLCNNFNNFYCRCRIMLEDIIKEQFNNILYLRIQYPISFNDNDKCFFSKIKTRLQNIDNVPVNITFLPSLFEKLDILIERQLKGIYNFVNPGHITIKDIIDIYNIIYNENLLYKLNKKDTFCGLLDTTKLEKEIQILPITEAIKAYLNNNPKVQ